MAEDKPQSTEAEIREGLGDISTYDVFGPQLLLGIFMRPGKTKGGIILTDKTVDEDRWQNKVGVVLKKGPQAFVPDEQNDFGGLDANEGDWVLCRTADGMPVDIRGVHCRLVVDSTVKMRVPDPSEIW